VLVGDGPLRSELEKEAESLGCKDRIRFVGDRRDIPAILASLDMTVLPSESESLSNVILESMAAGVPVVATEVGGNVELLSDGRGILVPAADESALAQAIELLADDPAPRAHMGLRAREFAKTNFTLERMRRQHEELYAELLEKKHWRPKAI
jgi:L-malate glycosyltransferase